ncbi:MAG: hypothetical protein AB7F76_14435 [Parvibaculaceae bacterium]
MADIHIPMLQRVCSLLNEALKEQHPKLDMEPEHQQLIALTSEMSEKEWTRYRKAVDALFIWYDDGDVRLKDGAYAGHLREKLEACLQDLLNDIWARKIP